MPSPFPGMDPYLEDPEFYPGLHNCLIVEINNTLQASLPPAYYAQVGSRVWIEYPERLIEPDVNVLRAPRPQRQPAQSHQPGPERVPTADSGVEIDVEIPAVESRDLFAEIHTVRGERSLVTTIELLSPSNKRPSEGREQYLLKQRELLESRVNLVEIDLLRGGLHTTSVPHQRALAAAGPFDYHVCIRAMDNLERRKVYPIRLQQSLPRIALPLLPGDPSLPLDLQEIFTRTYDHGPYSRIDLYPTARPTPPLSAEQAAWAVKLLRDKGLLPAE